MFRSRFMAETAIALAGRVMNIFGVLFVLVTIGACHRSNIRGCSYGCQQDPSGHKG